MAAAIVSQAADRSAYQKGSRELAISVDRMEASMARTIALSGAYLLPSPGRLHH